MARVGDVLHNPLTGIPRSIQRPVQRWLAQVARRRGYGMESTPNTVPGT